MRKARVDPSFLTYAVLKYLHILHPLLPILHSLLQSISLLGVRWTASEQTHELWLVTSNQYGFGNHHEIWIHCLAELGSWWLLELERKWNLLYLEHLLLLGSILYTGSSLRVWSLKVHAKELHVEQLLIPKHVPYLLDPNSSSFHLLATHPQHLH